MNQVRAKKALGQHFLTDLNIARKICDSLSGGSLDEPAKVLEVGCGMGVLTQFLLQRTDVVTFGAEIDTESVEYLHEHYNQRITLEMLAAGQNISISQLKRIFKEHTGDSVITYLTALRIKEAKRMIQEGNLNFTQIAQTLHYSTIHHFSRQFKEKFGITPTEYAKSVR